MEVFVFAPIVGLVVDGSLRFLQKRNPNLCDDEGNKILRLNANVVSLAICSTIGVLRLVYCHGGMTWCIL